MAGKQNEKLIDQQRWEWPKKMQQLKRYEIPKKQQIKRQINKPT